MSDIAISCRQISKRYVIGERERYRTLRDTLMNGLRAPFRRTAESPERPSVWALRDVSFQVRAGEVVGIIGRNGAGKSTLLKVLSRITEPTKGEAEIHGRVGSLLEVGTGFHPELTGRDNVFLNGAILGMNKAEIARKFDEIVAFAEVSEFIDTPVKRYSSGMYMRLAFAVAAHLDTEILLVDEVLAVGDAEFQKKCLGRMNEAARGGRTVLFVSHSMPAMQRLCPTALVLMNGQITYQGHVDGAIKKYLQVRSLNEYAGVVSSDKPVISRARASWTEGQGVVLEVDIESPWPVANPLLGLVFYDPSGNPVFGTHGLHDHHARPATFKSGRITVQIDTALLRPDTYTISLWYSSGLHETFASLEHVINIEIGAVQEPTQSHKWIGSISLPTAWTYS